MGCVAKTDGETRWAVKPHFLFSLGRHSKQVGDERDSVPKKKNTEAKAHVAQEAA